MRAYDNGCFFSVAVTGQEVRDFADRWPCSGLRNGPRCWFQFDKRNGDLVDLRGPGKDADGGAVSALADDAKRYGAKRLGLTL